MITYYWAYNITQSRIVKHYYTKNMNTIKINLIKNPARNFHLSKYNPKIESAANLELTDIVDALLEEGLNVEKESVMEIIRLFNRKASELVLSGHEVDTELVLLQPVVNDILSDNNFKADLVMMQGVELERAVADTKVEILNEDEIEEDLKYNSNLRSTESANDLITVSVDNPACGMAFRAWLFRN